VAFKKTERVVVYARISVSNDESVSIVRQVEACSKYAEARGWEVVAVVPDDGLSATHNKPEDRKGWREVLALQESYDAVVIWKLDRLARRVLDFLHADVALQARGAAVVCVEQPIDMTTAQGRAFATMLAVFAEMEADAISSRVRAARDYLLRNRRAVGGTVPYGYRNVENPDGAGFILAKDADTIDYVRGMAERALSGESIYSITKWLDEVGAPLPSASQKNRKRDGWHYSTVERILRSPVLAGMTPFNPGNESKVRGDGVLRDETGMPVVDGLVAILTTDERRKLLAVLDNRDSPQSRPRGGKRVTSPLLSGLATCGHCECVMHRGTTSGRPSLSCPECYQTLTLAQLTNHIVARLLSERGDLRGYEVTNLTEDNRAELADIEEAIGDVTAKLGRDNADVSALLGQLEALKELRNKARTATPTRRNLRVKERVVRLEWEAAQTDEERRSVLLGQLDALHIVRGRVGRYLDPARVQITWKPISDDDDEDPD
jgi:site-specific DNA recombinase